MKTSRKERQNQAQQLWREGLSAAEIAEDMHLSTDTIQIYVKEIRGDEKCRKNLTASRFLVHREARASALRMHRQGRSYREIATELGYSVNWVFAYIKQSRKKIAAPREEKPIRPRRGHLARYHQCHNNRSDASGVCGFDETFCHLPSVLTWGYCRTKE